MNIIDRMKIFLISLICGLYSFSVYAAGCPFADAYMKKGNVKDAVIIYGGCALNGDIKSQYSMANFYYLGNNVVKSFSNALYFYRLASENGFAPAQVKTALMYWRGEGAKQDLERALVWLIIASDDKKNKWFYPAMEGNIASENHDVKAKQYIKQLAPLLNDNQKRNAINKASEIKFNLLKQKAKEILNNVEYENFITLINQNINNKNNLEKIISDLKNKYIDRNKKNESIY